jgi:hypothetical protein
VTQPSWSSAHWTRLGIHIHGTRARHTHDLMPTINQQCLRRLITANNAFLSVLVLIGITHKPSSTRKGWITSLIAALVTAAQAAFATTMFMSKWCTSASIDVQLLELASGVALVPLNLLWTQAKSSEKKITEIV